MESWSSLAARLQASAFRWRSSFYLPAQIHCGYKALTEWHARFLQFQPCPQLLLTHLCFFVSLKHTSFLPSCCHFSSFSSLSCLHTFLFFSLLSLSLLFLHPPFSLLLPFSPYPPLQGSPFLPSLNHFSSVSLAIGSKAVNFASEYPWDNYYLIVGAFTPASPHILRVEWDAQSLYSGIVCNKGHPSSHKLISTPILLSRCASPPFSCWKISQLNISSKACLPSVHAWSGNTNSCIFVFLLQKEYMFITENVESMKEYKAGGKKLLVP